METRGGVKHKRKIMIKKINQMSVRSVLQIGCFGELKRYFSLVSDINDKIKICIARKERKMLNEAGTRFQ